jgi:RNA polymerase primary sigma factor
MSKTAMSKTEDAGAEEKDAPEGPILDLSDAAVKKMIKAAKARGFVTHEELNKVLPSDEFDSEAIENVMAQLNEMGINVVDNEEEGEAAEEDGKAGAVAVRDEAKPPVTNTREDADRTDDPVRMYLREMGSVELLSREGEIAIAKRTKARSPSKPSWCGATSCANKRFCCATSSTSKPPTAPRWASCRNRRPA